VLEEVAYDTFFPMRTELVLKGILSAISVFEVGKGSLFSK
jgi:hypothetical protein